jgi:hypothetical protein
MAEQVPQVGQTHHFMVLAGVAAQAQLVQQEPVQVAGVLAAQADILLSRVPM